MQKEVAARLGVTVCTVTNWEKNHTSAELRLLPRIVEFLGYCPYDPDWTAVERLAWGRKYRGFS